MSSTVADHLADAAAALSLAMADLGNMGSGTCEIAAASRAIVDLAEFVCTRSIGLLEREMVREDGFPNVSEWLLGNTNAVVGEGTRRQKCAVLLEQFPLWNQAVAEGVIGYAHVDAFARIVTKKRLAYAQVDEEMLLQAAKHFNTVAFGEVLVHWVGLCDDTVTAPESDDEAQAQRRFQLAQMGNGTWHVEGLLDALAGANLNAALQAAIPAPHPDDLRTTGQKQHDALNDIALESLANEERGEIGGERHHVTIVYEAENGLAKLRESGVLLSSVTRDMILCDCVVQSVWLTPTGEPFEIGTPKSSIPKKTRRAVAVRDQGCRFPGCCRPTRWTDIHHLTARADGGTHELRNLGSLCRFHHRYSHRKGLKMYWAADGVTLIVEWPNGVIKHSPPIQRALAG